MASLIKARVDETIRMLDLVRRDEFDAIADVAARARSEVAVLRDRVCALEAQVMPAPPRSIGLAQGDPYQDESAGAA
jgi:BMFP domain-containing protein YqiC